MPIVQKQIEIGLALRKFGNDVLVNIDAESVDIPLGILLVKNPKLRYSQGEAVRGFLMDVS